MKMKLVKEGIVLIAENEQENIDLKSENGV